MNVSYRWLLSLLPGYVATPDEVAERLARYGAPTEGARDVAAELGDVLIGRVVETGRHPNADRLSLCRVDAGTGELVPVVCGAPNVEAGAFYPFAPVGSALPGGVNIRQAKIRGEESRGMLCSARELGLGRDHEGILALHGEFTPGARFVEAVGLADTIFTLDVTPNRPDLLSHIGVARELAPDAGVRVGLPAIPATRGDPTLNLETGPRSVTVDGIRVTIEDPAGCPRYLGAVIRGVNIGPSPAWLDTRLRAVGVRTINNGVGATNYVLHELGQPLHAFDLAKLGDSVVIRRTEAGEMLRTLDGVDRKLEEGTLVIADAEHPVAMAGVMGGDSTEISATTHDVFLECAYFDPATVRASRRAAELSTDASYRFERGVDADGLERALRRCVEIIVATAGGTASRGVHAVGPALPPAKRVRIRPQRVSQVLGIELSAERIASLLGAIGFPAERSADALTVTVPGYRSRDVLREDDLVEEVARRHGYDEVPEEMRPYRPSVVPNDPLFAVEDHVRELLAGAGFLESRTAALAPETDGDVALLLPLSAAENRLRRNIVRGLLRRVEHNFARGARDVRLFEIGTVFRRSDDNGPPVEGTRVAAVMTGARAPLHWTGESGDFEIWDAKHVAEQLTRIVGARIEPSTAPPEESALFDLGTVLALVDEGAAEYVLGFVGRIADGVVDSPAWAAPVYAFEVALRADAALTTPVQYTPLPQHPATDRDLALLVPNALSAGAVEATIRGAAGDWLESVSIFDVYTGKGVPDGTRSIGYRLLFRAPDRTLTDEQADAQVERVLRRVKEEHGIERRG
jgi:phenylalanyl-tRNA synthetase beta chain